MTGTFIVNVSGSFILGFLMYATELGYFSSRERYLIGIGFCGGLTTFSTFIVQTLQFSGGLAVWNIIINVCLGIAFVFLGRSVALKELGT